jgi:hypothetical protein
VKRRWYIAGIAVLLIGLPVPRRLSAAENVKAKKEVVKPVKNGVRVYTSSRVLIGVLDKEAELEVLLEASQWCKVQYTKDGNRFVGWVLKEDLALPDSPPPKEEAPKPSLLSVKETSEQLRPLVRVGINYKTSRGEGWDPDVSVGVQSIRSGSTQMGLRFDDKGMQAKLVVLARFRRDHSIELYVEDKIVKLKQFREIAHPAFDRVIDSYIRALEAYNDSRSRIPDFKRLIESAERFWEVLDSQEEGEIPEPVRLSPLS